MKIFIQIATVNKKTAQNGKKKNDVVEANHWISRHKQYISCFICSIIIISSCSMPFECECSFLCVHFVVIVISLSPLGHQTVLLSHLLNMNFHSRFWSFIFGGVETSRRLACYFIHILYPKTLHHLLNFWSLKFECRYICSLFVLWMLWCLVFSVWLNVALCGCIVLKIYKFDEKYCGFNTHQSLWYQTVCTIGSNQTPVWMAISFIYRINSLNFYSTECTLHCPLIFTKITRETSTVQEFKNHCDCWLFGVWHVFWNKNIRNSLLCNWMKNMLISSSRVNDDLFALHSRSSHFVVFMSAFVMCFFFLLSYTLTMV